MTSQDVYSLASLGRELDRARRGRSLGTAASLRDAAIDSPEYLASPLPTVAELSPSPSRTHDHEDVERPYPLCLLCLTRPPTAVLLPCCHLNLCHICAPLLIMRHRAPPSSSPVSNPIPIPARGVEQMDDQASSIDSSSSMTPSLSPTRAPWHAVLARATANHPKARRLSMGGYIPPDIGSHGGEMTGEDVYHPAPQRTRFTSHHDDEGQVTLTGVETNTAQAQCLMCRTSVKGWLRVYVG